MSSSQQSYESALQECELEHIWSQMEQHLQARDHIKKTLQDTSAAFAAQATEPDGLKFMDACDQLTHLLDKKIPLELTEQQTLTQALQIGFAVQENALNNRTLTGTRRSDHQLATTAFFDLCKRAVDNGITQTDLWLEAFNLQFRAQKARDDAIEEFGLYKYLNFDDAEPSAPLFPVSEAVTPRTSLHDTADVGQTRQPTKLKEKALAMLNERPTKTAPLGRAHTMPTLSPSKSMSSSRSRMARPRGLQALEEE